jgi:soluble lytic murein transglycosylase-like protein
MRTIRAFVIGALVSLTADLGLCAAPRAQESAPIMAAGRHPSAANVGAIPPEAIARMLQAAAYLYAIDPALMAAIAQVESGNDSHARSPRGAIGLMQLMPQTAARFGVAHPGDPVENLLGAARFLNYLRQSEGHRQPLPDLLAAYNAGEGAVIKYRGMPPYAETRNYVRQVLIAYLAQPALPPAPRPDGDGDQPVPRSSYSAADGPAQADPFRQLELIQRERALAAGSHRNGAPAGGK